MAMQQMSDGDLTIVVAHSGNTAYGRARYVVVVRKAGESVALFESAALELPWRDDARAMRDALGFLAYYLDQYVLDGEEPSSMSGVTSAQLRGLVPYAETLAMFADRVGA